MAEEKALRQALVSHHHEDHAGNAAVLAAGGMKVWASSESSRLLMRRSPLRLYQHLIWGKPHPLAAPLLSLESLPPAAAGASPTAVPAEAPARELRVGPHAAHAIPAPGHCDDQFVFHVPSEGWLFAGDAFLHERVQYFRADEDFAKTVASCRRLLALDFQHLFCAHRPRMGNGKAALAEKLDWLLELEGRVRALAGKGLGERAITARLWPFWKRAWPAILFSSGDVSHANMVRSILRGPTPRPENLPDHAAGGL